MGGPLTPTKFLIDKGRVNEIGQSWCLADLLDF